VLDHVVGIDDKCCAERYAFVRIAHAELVDERPCHIGELPVIQAMEVAVIAPPAELGELVVGRTAQDDGVTFLEILREVGETDDLGRTDEREILRVEVDDLPLARERLLGERLECGIPVLFMMVEAGLHTDDVE